MTNFLLFFACEVKSPSRDKEVGAGWLKLTCLRYKLSAYSCFIKLKRRYHEHVRLVRMSEIT